MRFPAPIRKLARHIAGPVRRVPVLGQRKFEGADTDRLVASWTSSNTSINSEIYNSLRTLRARSRDLYNNNEHGKAFFGMLAHNVVGPDGLGFQSQARQNDGTLDTFDNEAMERRMRQWSKKGQCDVSRRMSRSELERMFVLGLARDGEVLFRKHRGFANDQRYALEAIDPDLLDIDHNQEPRDGLGRIVMGVEIDDYSAPIAYHFLTSHPSPSSPYAYPPTNNGAQRTRVPASEIIHVFLQLRPYQVRGIPWVHAAMRALRDLGGYREAAVIASRVGASKMGFYTSPDGMGAPYDGVDSAGNLLEDAQPGRFTQLPDGVSLDSWDPTYPHDQFEAFNKAMLRGLASGLGVSYFALNSDLESVNMSSARVGLQNERDVYRFVQRMTVEGFHDQWYPEWLATQLPQMNIPIRREEKFSDPAWIPRIWQSPDPLKDAQTAVLYLENNLTSAPRIIRERGMDPDEILRETGAWNERLAEIGLTMQPAAPGEGATNEDTQSSEDEETDNADAGTDADERAVVPLRSAGSRKH